ncbi:hypothetical protein BZL30_3074 [Mycobacterium kansasii]|uniref:Uncharacterized protein n=1 Tax=Mycobacterium kansasii TaxID=1768 RepID=A0A1V3XBS0_MYCKA|nr:hypothetical protein BZL30_3074 [Mycobacterium kansasii]
MHATRDAAGQVLQSFQQVGFGFDVWAASTSFSASAIASVSGPEKGLANTTSTLERVPILSQWRTFALALTTRRPSQAYPLERGH